MNPHETNFEDFADEEFDFYGVRETFIKLDEMVYEIVEGTDHPAGEVIIRPELVATFGLPLGRVTIEHDDSGDSDIYKVIDLHDGHEWLCFGIRYEGFSEYFFFNYTPKSGENS